MNVKSSHLNFKVVIMNISITFLHSLQYKSSHSEYFNYIFTFIAILHRTIVILCNSSINVEYFKAIPCASAALMGIHTPPRLGFQFVVLAQEANFVFVVLDPCHLMYVVFVEIRMVHVYGLLSKVPRTIFVDRTLAGSSSLFDQPMHFR